MNCAGPMGAGCVSSCTAGAGGGCGVAPNAGGRRAGSGGCLRRGTAFTTRQLASPLSAAPRSCRRFQSGSCLVLFLPVGRSRVCSSSSASPAFLDGVSPESLGIPRPQSSICCMPLTAGVLALTLWKTPPLTCSEFHKGRFRRESGR